LESYGFERLQGFSENNQALTPDEKEAYLSNALETLQPGKWLFVDHPAYDTPEMQHIYHKGYENVAQDRQGVTQAWSSERVKQIIADRNIQLISYTDVKQGSLT
ncbi:MAG: hypothetical protein AAF485_30645, partial [Chloroflexota bacterium]